MVEISVIEDPHYGVAVDYFEAYHDLPEDDRAATSA